MRTKHILTTFLALSLAATSAFAQRWKVEYTSGTRSTVFTITRLTEKTGSSTVYYRTVSMSAVEGVHYIPVSGSLVFGPNEETKTVEVFESFPENNPLYCYQANDGRRYMFEVLDPGGFQVAQTKRIFLFGDKYLYHNDYVSNTMKRMVYLNTFQSNTVEFPTDMSEGKYMDIAYTPSSGVEDSGTLAGFVSIDDSYDYKERAALVNLAPLYNSTGLPASYLQTQQYKVFATVCFTMKEKNDGYQYVQILVGDDSFNPTSYDGADPDPTKDPGPRVNDPSISIYKAVFELDAGTTVYDYAGRQFFPHRYDYRSRAEGNQHERNTEFYSERNVLYQQKFKNGYRAEDNPALVFDPTYKYVITRFDCAGKDNDTWGFKDLFVRTALLDATRPTIGSTPIVNGGRHARGNPIYVSVSFSEIVNVSDLSQKLYTTWGDLKYETGQGTNVITYSGTISSDASGTLKLRGFSTRTSDLSGNVFTSPWNESNPLDLGITLDDDYVYPIDYNLQDGSVETANPISYTYFTPEFTLNNPTRFAYDFAGWLGTDVSFKSTSVTVKTHSFGPRNYTAYWTPIKYNIAYDTQGGSLPANIPTKYTIESEDITLANPKKAGSVFAGWTGTGLTEPTMTVVIEKGSTGDRSYTATWSPVWDGSGSSGDPYVITTPEGMVMFSQHIETTPAATKYFELGADIDMSGVDFTPIGISKSKYFGGYFDGKGFTVSNLTVNNTEGTYAGLFGYVMSGRIQNLILSGASITGGEYAGGIVGSKTGLEYLRNCFVINSSITGTTAGVIAGYYEKGAQGNIQNNYYYGCSVNGVYTNVGCGNNASNDNAAGDITLSDGASQVYKLTLGGSISASPEATVTYGLSDYYKSSTEITLSVNVPGYNANGFTVTKDGTNPAETVEVTHSNNKFRFKMPAADATVSADISVTPGSTVNLTLVKGTKDGVTSYWGTYYNGLSRYTLPEGASAFTMDDNKNLYRVGTDGKVIPAGTAVIIIADAASVQLTASDSTTEITVNGSSNILTGSDTAVILTGGKAGGKTPYVMGLVGDPAVLGFYKFSGSAIPANKAYYVE